MRTPFIIAAVVSAFAATASAAPFTTPYVLSAVHADFLTQLEKVAETPGEIGTAARAAADLLAAHNEAEERVALPLLGLTEEVAEGKAVDDPEATLASLESLQAELPLLVEGQAEAIGALVKLFAAAEAEGEADVSRLAERIIWHELTDAEILYSAATLVGATVQAGMADADVEKN
ncbi:MAG: hypothetical protein H6852_09215 [Geminicoccaceae bacterium]|jgi:hypothetical protein|nr:hypothetical protein [Geminicoccaceae bacterium]HRY26338.1 hypothetical protein [Geminicoccaceae bacterium]